MKGNKGQQRATKRNNRDVDVKAKNSKPANKSASKRVNKSVVRKESRISAKTNTTTLLKDKGNHQKKSVALTDSSNAVKSEDGYVGSLVPDVIDFRDRVYNPSLSPLPPQIHPPLYLQILDQKSEGACAGFALAAVVNLLARKQGREHVVSARMLYEMAKKFDDWPSENYAGASCRGAIKGLFNMGVCADSDWPFVENKPGHLTAYRAEQARATTIGAYYRVGLSIADFHAALNETGAIYASAMIHRGWAISQMSKGKINWKNTHGITGGHAFAIIGYDATGFFIQNSRGEEWGNSGVAHWSYEDWQENIRDPWVFQLALPTPQVFPGFAREAISAGVAIKRAPRRNEIMGHFVHLDDGNFHNRGRYFSCLDDVAETANRVANSDKYDHILFFAHDSFNSPKVCAQKIAAMQSVFKSNGIYSYHFIYSSGFVDDVKNLLALRSEESESRLGSGHELSDRLVEVLLGNSGRALWREMKYAAEAGFVSDGDGLKVVNTFLQHLATASQGVNGKKIHLLGHSAGSLLVGHLLRALTVHQTKPQVGTVSLMAPTITLDAYNNIYRPSLANVNDLTVYNLSDVLELEDNVAGIYGKSILHLISRVLEAPSDNNVAVPLLGLSRDVELQGIAERDDIDFVISQGDVQKNKNSGSRRHDDFDTDTATMNHILRRILGRRPNIRFRSDHFSD